MSSNAQITRLRYQVSQRAAKQLPAFFFQQNTCAAITAAYISPWILSEYFLLCFNRDKTTLRKRKKKKKTKKSAESIYEACASVHSVSFFISKNFASKCMPCNFSHLRHRLLFACLEKILGEIGNSLDIQLRN